VSTPTVTYGDQILGGALHARRPYTLVSDPVPLRLYLHVLDPTPTHVITPPSLERRELDELEIPAGHTVVGLGGGMVLDAAKYVARGAQRPLLLVPTIASTNTAFTPFASVREGGVTVGTKLEGLRWDVLVDLALLRRAEPRFNRAGFGDLLALETAMADAIGAARDGRAPGIDGQLVADAEAVVDRAIAIADEVGSVTDGGLRALVELLANWSELTARCVALGAGTEHLFAWNLERVTGRKRLHGEAVALGVLVASHFQDGRTASLRDAFDRARVRWRPGDLEVDRTQLAATLGTIADYNRTVRRIPAVVDLAPWDPALLQDLWEAIT
jgi:glycerol-1-phosphate dehydrogenase [NAD(P)+]